MAILHTRVKLSEELDQISTYDANITSDGHYLIWTQNDGYELAWVNLSRYLPDSDPLAHDIWVWKHHTHTNLVHGELITNHIYTDSDQRVYILTHESEPRIYVLHLPSSTIECCLIADAEQWVCRLFVGIWPDSGQLMLTLYCMDNVLYSYRIDTWLQQSSRLTISHTPTDDIQPSIDTTHSISTRVQHAIPVYYLKTDSEFCISGWVFRHLPLTVIQGCRAIFHDGRKLCAINLERKVWDRQHGDQPSTITMHPGITKRIELSCDNKYVYVMFFNGTISQYRNNRQLDCVGHYSIQLHPFSRTPLPWPEYMNEQYLDIHSSHIEPGAPVIAVRPPIANNKYFINHTALETIADQQYSNACDTYGVNTWRLLNTSMGRILYRNPLEFIQPLGYIKSSIHSRNNDSSCITYRCADKIMQFANLDMPLNRRTLHYFPTPYQYIARGHSWLEAPEIIQWVCSLPLELIELVGNYITLSDAILHIGENTLSIA